MSKWCSTCPQRGSDLIDPCAISSGIVILVPIGLAAGLLTSVYVLHVSMEIVLLRSKLQ